MRTFLFLLGVVGVVTAEGYKRVCYYSNWSQYRSGAGKFVPEDIPATLCTHLIYSFSKLGPDGLMAMYEWNDDQLYQRFNALKQKNPELRTLLAIGGWNAGSIPFSNLVADPVKRRNFAVNAADFLEEWGFDGLDLDWEYPAARGGIPDDKKNFILWIQDLAEEFGRRSPRLLLTAAVAAGKGTVDNAYDIPAMARYLDFINLMSYDLHGAWEPTTGHNSPLYARADEQGEDRYLNLAWAANYWTDKGCPKEKLIVGLATYGRSFRLANSANTGMGAPATGAGPGGPYLHEAGFLSYYEACGMLEQGATRVWNAEQQVPYLVQGDTWLGYDDAESIIAKLEFIRDNRFGGAMVWNIDLDDFRNLCQSSGGPYPLMRLMEPILGGYSPPSTTSGPPKPTTTSLPPSSTTEDTDATTRPASPSDCSGLPDGSYIQDPANCDSYFRCVSGVPVAGKCNSPLLWNQQRQYCDWEYNVQCSPVTNQPTPEATTTTTKPSTTEADTTNAPVTTTTTTKPVTTTTPGTTDAPVTTQKPTSGVDCSGVRNGAYISDPANCDVFFQCVSGDPVPGKCNSPLLWNQQRQYCDWEYNVQCSSESPATEEPTSDDDDDDDAPFCADKPAGLHADPDDCSRYYNCHGGLGVSYACASGTYWSVTVGYCDWISNVDCQNRPEPSALLESECTGRADGFYTAISSCHDYIRCHGNVVYHHSCGDTLYFNPLLNVCDWPANVDCS